MLLIVIRHYNLQTVIEDLDSINQISSITAFRNLKFKNYRVLLKTGLGVNLNPITFGLTVNHSKHKFIR